MDNVKESLEIIKQFILQGDKDIEKEWDAYQKIRKALGLEPDMA